MAENTQMRLSLAARKLNISIITIADHLAEKGEKIDNNPNTKLTQHQLEILAKDFSNTELLGEKPTAPSAKTKESTNDDSEILFFRDRKEEPSVSEKPATAPKEAEPAFVERKVEGLKIIGKIELDKKGNPVPPKPLKEAINEIFEPKKPVEEVVAPTPVVEEKPAVEEKVVAVEKPAEEKTIETPVAEAKPEVKQEIQTPVVEAPPVATIEAKEEIKEQPVQQPIIETQTPPIEVIASKEVEPTPAVIIPEVISTPKTPTKVEPPVAQVRPQHQQKPEHQKPKFDHQKPKHEANNGGGNKPKQAFEQPKKDKPNVATTKPEKEENQEIELIKAKSEKLQGLKVLGKIELPVGKESSNEGKKKRKRKRVKRTEKVSEFPNDNSQARTKPKEPSKDNQANKPVKGKDDAQKQKPNQNQGQNQNQNQNQNQHHKKDRNRKEVVSESDVKDNIKQTMARLNQNRGGTDFGAKYRKEKRNRRAELEELQNLQEQEASSILKVTEFISASELASMMDVSVNEVIGKCMQMGMFVSINQRLDAEAIQLIALEFGYDVEFISAEEEVLHDTLEIHDDAEDLKPRAPIVTIMGHVDHGKTSLLDYIRRSKVAEGEAGGITQHIGAYSVKMKEGVNKGKMITFLDTPGHEAFTAMRARGAKITDVAIIVVAADDSVMPQTREAINHAQNAGVPIVFAINKIDKPAANPSKIREDLSKENILVESWGGKYQEQEVSAKKGIGIDELLDKVLLEAELLELKANPNRRADGTIIEASLDKGRGYVATVLVQNGTLKVGDILLAGQYHGRVRAMVNDLGNRIKEAGPSIPVQILGLPGAPQAGDKFNVMETEREAREIANKREQIHREQSIRAKKHITLDEIGRRKAIGSFQELNVIVKGDVDGSVEALSDSLLKLSTDEIQVRIIHKGVGQISESDILLASAADAILIGFQVRPSMNARKLAEQEEIEIRLYSVIYDAINELRDALEGMLAPKEEEVIVGNIEIRETFKISKVGTIAGCYVLDGYVKRNNKIRIIRDGIVTHEGEISALKRYKDDVNEVKAGYECGLSIKNYNDIQVGDIIESFEIREIKRKL